MIILRMVCVEKGRPLQCVAACHGVVQRVAMCSSMLQCVAVCS